MLQKRFFFEMIMSGFLVLGGCSAYPSNTSNNGRIVNFTGCQLPKDQGKGSLNGNWAALPVPIVFDRDFYVADEGEIVPSLRNALLSWNLWAGLRGTLAFQLRNDGSGISAGMLIPELTGTCAQATYSASVTDQVGIWKITGYGNHRNRREACGVNADGTPGKILPDGVQGQTDWTIQGGKIIGASILLNFEDYNAPGKRRIDVESLLLHEMGHVLGLLHSCNGSTSGGTDSTTAPACFTNIGGQNVLTAPARYTDAVMFPFLQVEQERRNLQQNDYDRINCLY